MSDDSGILRTQWTYAAANGDGAVVAHVWLPPQTPQAIVQIAHGMSEHGTRYDEFARFLCERGLCVVANDHSGHGQSAQGHLGSFSSRPGGFDDAVVDLHSLFEQAEKAVGALPRILLGHSMGSVLSALYAERYTDLTALIMSGTPSNITASHLFQFLAGLIAHTRGHLAPSPLLERLTGSAAKLSLEEALQARAWLTRDPQKVREFCTDPLCGFDYTAGGYHTMLKGYHFINSDLWGLHTPDVPILLVAGAKDTASDCGRGPTRYAAQLAFTQHTQVEFKLFDECRHELLNELNREEISDFLYQWMQEKLELESVAG